MYRYKLYTEIGIYLTNSTDARQHLIDNGGCFVMVTDENNKPISFATWRGTNCRYIEFIHWGDI